MTRRASLLALAAILATATRAWGQGIQPPPEQSDQRAAPEALPGAFIEEDQSPFLTGLRRFEIIAFGSFPIMLFYSNVGFDLSRYIRSGYDPYYAPWPVKSEYSYQASTPELLASIGTAALLSVGIATLDAVIRASRVRRAAGRPARVDSP